MTYEWYFAPSNGGQKSGLNDSGVSYFAADPIRSIAKEALQDSLDARSSDNGKVIVKFNNFDVSKNEIPDYINLNNAFEKGIERWEHHQETKSFFEKGLNILKKNKVPVLAIQDYQTTGLSKVGNSTTGGWQTLISSSGFTEKSSTDGGSYGIGRNAPFAASALRTVLYCTKNREEEIGFQGVAKIPTIQDKDNKDTQGIGYFFDPTDEQPIKDIEDIMEPYRREKYGTDKFILGFNDSENWIERLIDEVISSYLIAVYEETLEVHVNGFIISKSTLPEVIDKIKKYNKDSLALQYYEVLQSKFSKTFELELETDNKEKESVKLKLLAKDGFKKRVGMHRYTGMKIYDKGHFHTPIDFSGVFIVEGQRLNEVLRKMEPPTHDKWDYKLFKENEKYARKLIKELNQWMSKCSNSLLNDTSKEDIQISGIEELLPKFSDEEAKTVEIKKDGLKDRVSSIHPRKRKKRSPKPGSRTPGDDLPGKGRGNGSGSSEGGQKGSPGRNKKRTAVSEVNAYCTNQDDQIYSVFFSAPSKGEVTFEINAVGENGKTDILEIKEAVINGVYVPVAKNVIGPFNMDKAENERIEVKINTINRLALEVIQL